MLMVTEKGHYYTAVEDFYDPEIVWVRSQDRESIEEVIRGLGALVPVPDERVTYELVDRPDWDYEFRVKLTKELWALWLGELARSIDCHTIKSTVAQARGHGHPISKMVESVFYFMSNNRPDGSIPGWLR